MRFLPRRDPLANPEDSIRRVYAYVAYRIGDGPDAEDVTSETLARAVRYRDSYEPSKGQPIGWLIGIARRCVDDHLGRPAVTHRDPPDVAAEHDLERETVDRLTLHAAMAQLSDRDRELVGLRYGADLSARQIAEQLGLKTNAVEVALHRAVARLRGLLEEPDARVPAPVPGEETASSAPEV